MNSIEIKLLKAFINDKTLHIDFKRYGAEKTYGYTAHNAALSDLLRTLDAYIDGEIDQDHIEFLLGKSEDN